MPHAWLAPGPRGMMPADDLNRIGRAVQRLGRIPSLRCQANRYDTQRNCYSSFGRFSRVARRRSGGARRDRTDDLLLAKQALSQLSYGPVSTVRLSTLQPPSQASDLVEDPATREHWWAWKDLNFRPHAYQARALTN
jgi:hypothetical protein